MTWMMSQVATMLGTALNGADCQIAQVSTDTRKLRPGSLFFALRGPNFDAHDVLDEQPELDLSGLVVSREVAHPAAAIQVENTLAALQKFAAQWRQEFHGKLVGLTGSNGKTTVKEMIAAVFSQAGSTFATRGNLNNEIGVPLSLLELRHQHQRAVIEMGANHPGEIAALTAMAKPDIALVNNAGDAHLEGFGSREGVARAKAEIFSGLSQHGIAVINLDDRYANYWLELNQQRRCVTFGRQQGADCRLISTDPLKISLHDAVLEIPFHLLGEHNGMNAAAACAVAVAAEIPHKHIISGLSAVQPVGGRLAGIRGAQGETLIDDSYNANPSSVAVAIQTLADFSGERLLVLGDLGELGPAAIELHEELGILARDANLDGLFTLGELSRAAAAAFGPAAVATDSLDELLDALKPRLSAGVVVLIKGSRTAGMERVIAALRAVEDDAQTEIPHAV